MWMFCPFFEVAHVLEEQQKVFLDTFCIERLTLAVVLVCIFTFSSSPI